jgi:integrase/recombinase XerD
MDTQEVRWEHYARVAAHAAARAFVERLVLKGKQPKTVDAYARAVEDLLAYFARFDLSLVIEAGEGDLDMYIADLKQRGPKKRGRGGMIEDETKVRYLTGRKLSDNTIAQRVVACRLFYEFLIRKQLRSDPVNPIERGNDGRDGQRPARGPIGKKERLAWIPPDAVWEDLVRHIMLHEDPRTQAMILLAYDAALRREELVSLRVDDIDWALEVVKVRAETTKGGRERYVPVSAGVLYLVRSYIEGDRRTLVAAYDGDDLGPLFLSESTRNPGRPLAVGTFNEIVERVRAKVGLPAFTPHTLRHLRCTTLKRAGVSLENIALFAGHKDTKTTILYIRLAPVELGKLIRQKVEPFDARIRVLIMQATNEEAAHAK